MLTDPVRLLIVGPAGGEVTLAAELARAEGADVAVAGSVADAVADLRGRDAQLVMIDVGLDVPGFMAALAAERIRVPVLGCGVDAPAERAVAAVRAGARDYVPLPPERELIAAALSLAATRPAAELVGADPRLLRALAFGRAIAPSAMPVLVLGEPGTGRETLARLVHAASGRTGPFLTVACAGAPADVIESELWGHAAGAFPGAAGARNGRIQQAAAGTLFVRNVDRLPPALQARLAAGTGPTRLIASAAGDLDERVAAGGFRADLRARFAAELCLPPLRDRTGDLPALADHLGGRLAERNGRPALPFAPEALALAAGYAWPGNVRELEDAVHRALVLSRGVRVEPDDLVLADGARLSERAAPAPPASEGVIASLVGRTVDEVERDLILETLERCRGNRTSASGILGISVRTMRNKLRAFTDAGIAVPAAAA